MPPMASASSWPSGDAFTPAAQTTVSVARCSITPLRFTVTRSAVMSVTRPPSHGSTPMAVSAASARCRDFSGNACNT